MCDSERIIDDEDKAMELELKKYEILYTAYADEIRNLWQRSIFLGAFMVLVWSGYGALQLKAIEKCLQTYCAYHYASLGLCFVIIILSLLWVAMAKGSKFVQEAHEAHIKDFNFDEKDTKKLFCKLESYEYKTHQDDYNDKDKKEINKDLNPSLFFGEVMKSYRYSPSKINIALGWTSILIACMLVITHIYRLDIEYPNTILAYLSMIVCMLLLCPLSCFIKKQVKGGETDTRLHFLQCVVD